MTRPTNFWLRRLLPAGVVVLLLLAAWWWVQRPPSVQAGSQTEGYVDTWHRQQIRLPHVDVVARTTPAVSNLADLDRDEESTVVDGDGSFIGVRVDAVPLPVHLTEVEVRDEDFQVAIRVDGRRYPLTADRGYAGRQQGSSYSVETYLAVDASASSLDADDVAVEVTYDGVTQSVTMGSGRRSTPGGSRWLYAPERRDQQSCPGYAHATGSLRGPTVSCTLTWSTVVYDPRLGWAPPGKRFVHVTIDLRQVSPLSRQRAGDEETRYRPARLMTGLTLDGTRPARPHAPLVVRGYPSDEAVDAVFATTPGPHEVEASFRWTWTADQPGQRDVALTFDRSARVQV